MSAPGLTPGAPRSPCCSRSARAGRSTRRSTGRSSGSPSRTAGWRTSSPPACCGSQTALDERLAPLVPRGWASVAPELKDVLRLGAFQLTALDRVPAHAAVDTSVALAKEAGGARAGGFVNAVLRRVGRLEPRRLAGPPSADAGAPAGSDRGQLAAAVAPALAGGALARRGSVRRRPSRAAPLEQHPAPARAAAGARDRGASSSGAGGRPASRSTPAPFGAGLIDRPVAPAGAAGLRRGRVHGAGPGAGAARVVRGPARRTPRSTTRARRPAARRSPWAAAWPGSSRATLSRARVRRLAENLRRAGQRPRASRSWPTRVARRSGRSTRCWSTRRASAPAPSPGTPTRAGG